jgi:ubiquinone/menaquinone biosynthesis C-methylase UbiE
MTTNYDAIAEEYKKAKLQPWRLHIETFMLSDLVGDVTGKSVLDLACGEGFHTRLLRQKGAGRVVGVDLFAGMIDLARQEEARRPLGIEYVQQDAKELNLKEAFDLVFAAYLLNYAETKEALRAMCQAIARHLKPGCRFVTINNNPDYTGATDAMRKYGFTREAIAPVDGTPVAYDFFLDDGTTFGITNYYLSKSIHAWAFAEAGLRNLRWHPPRIAPEGLAEYGQDFWADFLQFKPVICLDCDK